MSAVAPEFLELFALARGYQRSRAISVAAELGIADRLGDGPCSVEELAAATSAHAPTLYRLLRALAAIGVFHEDDERRFSLTPMGDWLRTDRAASLGPVVRLLGADYEWKAWGELLHSVRTGDNAARHALGTDVWTYRRRHPEDGEVFDAAMRTMALTSVPTEIAAYDFGRHEVVADVAGGTGTLLAAILERHPRLRGILFDQPHVAATARPVLERAGVADRVSIESGSFFERVPGGADAYVLRRILHNWLDAEAAGILRRCREAMLPSGRLVIIDSVVGPPDQDASSKFLDLMMLVSAGGKQRTEPEWRALLAEAGFRLVRTTPATPATHVIEAASI